MYIPKAFRGRDEQQAFDLIDAYPFATLTSVVDGAPFVTHAPVLLAREEETLYGHLARANPHAEALFANGETLAVFHGPHAYVSPRWFDSPNVPTWNYAVVHVYGRAKELPQPELRALLDRLTARFEPPSGGWQVASLPEAQVESLLQAIRGFALPLERLESKFKLSQNRSRPLREGVIAGLRDEAGEPELAQLMTEAMNAP